MTRGSTSLIGSSPDLHGGATEAQRLSAAVGHHGFTLNKVKPLARGFWDYGRGSFYRSPGGESSQLFLPRLAPNHQPLALDMIRRLTGHNCPDRKFPCQANRLVRWFGCRRCLYLCSAS